MKRLNIYIIGLILFTILIGIVSNREIIVDKEKLLGDDYRLFQQSPAWDLAKAVEDEDEDKVKEILKKNPKLINYRESKWGMTLLMVATERQQMKAFKILLDNGADVSIHERLSGLSALHSATQNRNIEFVEMLLKHGANPNDVSGPPSEANKGYVTTPLICSAANGRIDMMKLLLKSGALINMAVGRYKWTPLHEAVVQDQLEAILFLLENGADYKSPICYRPDFSIPSELEDPNDMGEPIYLVNELRRQTFILGSSHHKQKMKIVDFLEKRGIDYKSVPIPPYTLKYIKEEYPKSWKQYIDEY